MNLLSLFPLICFVSISSFFYIIKCELPRLERCLNNHGEVEDLGFSQFFGISIVAVFLMCVLKRACDCVSLLVLAILSITGGV